MFTNHPEAKIHNLSKGFGKKVILDQLSLDIYPGTCTGILGENGCGKSTFGRNSKGGSGKLFSKR